MTPEQIQRRLDKVSPEDFSGRTAERFRQLWQLTGLNWRDTLVHFAESGYRWKDAAAFFGMHPTTLQAYCYKRGARIPFRGQTHPEAQAARRAAVNKHPERHRRYHNRANYTAFGVSDSLSELLRRFGHPSLTWAAVYGRIHRGWAIEDALLAENGQPPGNASTKGKAA